MQVHCISVSEHIWVGGCGPRGVGELPAGGIRASQGTFSSCFCIDQVSSSQFMPKLVVEIGKMCPLYQSLNIRHCAVIKTV